MANRYKFSDVKKERESILNPIGNLYMAGSITGNEGKIVKITAFAEGYYIGGCPNATWGGMRISMTQLKLGWDQISSLDYNNIVRERINETTMNSSDSFLTKLKKMFRKRSL